MGPAPPVVDANNNDQSVGEDDAGLKDSDGDAVKAVEKLSEEGKTPVKIAKKKTAAGVPRDYIKQKMEREKSAIANWRGERPKQVGRRWGG